MGYLKHIKRHSSEWVPIIITSVIVVISAFHRCLWRICPRYHTAMTIAEKAFAPQSRDSCLGPNENSRCAFGLLDYRMISRCWLGRLSSRSFY